ncbi:hypothetical protein [Gracilimonas sp.]|uniref:hypothetical protein n=1 Tax=Gracilimonas sp. TaxID=1974203 RepID=UPI0032EFECE5
MRFLYLLATLMLIVSIQPKLVAQDKTPSEILRLSQERHDPNANWESAKLHIHLQEPRPQTPSRYSILYLDNATGEFRLTRTVEEGVIERIITPTGEAKILLNGSDDFSEAIREKYRLNAGRNSGYKSFYQILNGLPMSLNKNVVEEIQRGEDGVFEEMEIYTIRVELIEQIISKYWVLHIAKEDYSLVGLKFDHHEDSNQEDELIHFGGEFTFEEVIIPRFRHWYHEDSKEYLGTDVIVKEIPQN